MFRHCSCLGAELGLLWVSGLFLITKATRLLPPWAATEELLNIFGFLPPEEERGPRTKKSDRQMMGL